MEALIEEHEKLSRKGNLSKSLDDVQKTIDLLVKARDSIAASMSVSFPYNSLTKTWVSQQCSSLLARSEQRFGDASKAPESCQAIIRGHQQRPEGCLQRPGQLFESIG